LKQKLIAATVAALALAIAGTATAAYRTTVGVRVAVRPHVSVGLAHKHGNHLVGGSFLAAASTYLGLDKAAILADLKAGQSLAQIATAQNTSTAGLVTALIAPAKLKLDAAVAAGKLTAERETALLTRLQTAVTNVVNRSLPARTGTKTRPVHVSPTAILQPALTYLGLDLRAVVVQLRSGKSLADIAVAQNKTASGLVDTIVASVKTKLDAQVAAGKLTSAQETSFLATLQTTVTKFVNG
jgi:hypothetical protein